MRIIHSGGFLEDERRENKAVIYSNMVIAFKVLLDIMGTEGFDFENEKTKVGISSEHYDNSRLTSLRHTEN